jgi:TPR repeat protein
MHGVTKLKIFILIFIISIFSFASNSNFQKKELTVAYEALEKKDYEKAKELFKKACEYGEPKGCNLFNELNENISK